jgi:hypothetical protein
VDIEQGNPRGKFILVYRKKSIVSGYGLDDLAIEVRFPAETKGFFL